MKAICRRLLLYCLFIMTCTPLVGQKFETIDATGMQWFKGNIHTHTKVGGVGDSTPEAVASWYKAHGYNFLIITDHYTVTLLKNPESIVDSRFILISGQESRAYVQTEDIDVGGLGIETQIPILHGKSVLEGLQTAIDAVRTAGGVPVINHPNYNWRLTSSIIEATSNCYLLELFNGGPTTNSFGDVSHPSVEHMWDFLLSNGKRIYGVATDDANHFFLFTPDKWNPGRGWVVVRALKLSQNDILRSLECGQFYSSTGIILQDIVSDASMLQIKIQVEGDCNYLTEFIGTGGTVIYRTNSTDPRFILNGQSGYVRARITDSLGHMAWIQPSFISVKQ